MTETLTFDPAPGTERLHSPTCQLCGSRHMSRTGLCDACQCEAMELGKGIMLVGKGGAEKVIHVQGRNLVITNRDTRKDWSDRIAPWVIGISALYFGVHIILAVMRGVFG